MDRTEALLRIRPILNIDDNVETNPTEKFQNMVLRPLLKLQHDFLCFLFLKSPEVNKLNFIQKHKDQQERIIIDFLKSNQKMKASIIQSIVSLMTIEELEQYYTHRSEYNKRIISMASMRLIDGLIVHKGSLASL